MDFNDCSLHVTVLCACAWSCSNTMFNLLGNASVI